MNEYHGIAINLSQKDSSVLDELEIIGRKKVIFKVLVLLKLRVTADCLDATIHKLQTNMRSHLGLLAHSFYFHFYNDRELVVVFKNKIFHTKPDPECWGEIINYGLSLGIPRKQLDFLPYRFDHETY